MKIYTFCASFLLLSWQKCVSYTEVSKLDLEVYSLQPKYQVL